MTDEVTPAINASPLPAMASVFFRDLLKVAGAGLVSRGLITSDLLDQGIGLLITAAPILYSQRKTFLDHVRLLWALRQQPGSVPLK